MNSMVFQDVYHGRYTTYIMIQHDISIVHGGSLFINQRLTDETTLYGFCLQMRYRCAPGSNELSLYVSYIMVRYGKHSTHVLMTYPGDSTPIPSEYLPMAIDDGGSLGEKRDDLQPMASFFLGTAGYQVSTKH